MSEKSEKPLFEEAKLCGWCGVQLNSTNLARQLVCVRCYELLKNANLSSAEIFGDDWRKAKNRQSDVDNQSKE